MTVLYAFAEYQHDMGKYKIEFIFFTINHSMDRRRFAQFTGWITDCCCFFFGRIKCHTCYTKYLIITTNCQSHRRWRGKAHTNGKNKHTEHANNCDENICMFVCVVVVVVVYFQR